MQELSFQQLGSPSGSFTPAAWAHKPRVVDSLGNRTTGLTTAPCQGRPTHVLSPSSLPTPLCRSKKEKANTEAAPSSSRNRATQTGPAVLAGATLLVGNVPAGSRAQAPRLLPTPGPPHIQPAFPRGHTTPPRDRGPQPRGGAARSLNILASISCSGKCTVEGPGAGVRMGSRSLLSRPGLFNLQGQRRSDASPATRLQEKSVFSAQRRATELNSTGREITGQLQAVKRSLRAAGGGVQLAPEHRLH